MAQIWGQSDMYSNFPIFFRFGILRVFLTKMTCLVRVGKHLIVIFGFLAFQCYLFFEKFHLELREKALCQLKKSMSTCVILAFFQNTLLGGEW